MRPCKVRRFRLMPRRTQRRPPAATVDTAAPPRRPDHCRAAPLHRKRGGSDPARHPNVAQRARVARGVIVESHDNAPLAR